MSCLAEMMPLPIVSPNGDRVVDHRLLLGVASSSDRSWLHRVRGATCHQFANIGEQLFSHGGFAPALRLRLVHSIGSQRT